MSRLVGPVADESDTTADDQGLNPSGKAISSPRPFRFRISGSLVRRGLSVQKYRCGLNDGNLTIG